MAEVVEMSVCTVYLPDSLTLENTIRFSNHLHDLPEADEYIFDFDALNWIEPFSLLLLSSEIQRCRDKVQQKRFSAVNHKTKTYAGHMGFFKAFGCDFGKKPSEAVGNSRYIPITIYDSAEIQKAAYESSEAVGQFIENIAANISHVLLRTYDGELFDTFTYSIREIIRNVIEHSNSGQFGFCAQYWPNKNQVELALLDRGIGIKKGLSSNPHLNINSDHEALNLALMPGVSGKAFKGSKQNKDDNWANSGFGLYMTSRLCREGGSFYIASGNTSLMLSEQNKDYMDTPFQGTALRLILNTNRIKSLNKMLEQYRGEAEKIKSHFSAENFSASTASRMLTKDFKT
ncbi:MAG TPA: hypothetical protein PKL42_08995 [Methylotenera sp.]|nr:hypothetical protein [Methylotenera sp.]HPV32217.1 hypothetical protein [Methylotenera sp.]